MFQLHSLPNLHQQDRKIFICTGGQYVQLFKFEFRILRVDSKSG